MSNKTVEEVRKDFVEKSNKARQQKQYQSMLNSCSAADREAISMLEKIDLASGGNLLRLVQVYQAIKQQSN